MLKKISSLFLLFIIGGCGLIGQTNDMPQQTFNYQNSIPQNTVEMTDYSHIDLGNSESFRVAMLLPLSGKVSDMGQNMKNAAMMAIGDLNNNNLVVQFYDTKSTTGGARIAVENAINAKSDLIIGPLLGEEVAAISETAKKAVNKEIIKESNNELLKAIDILNKDERRTLEVRFIKELFVFTKCDYPEEVIYELKSRINTELVDIFN